MREKEKFLILDVETANNLDFPLVYDIGFAVTDRDGTIYEKQSLVIYDIYRGERALMDSCYYAKKIPEYEKLLREKKARIVLFTTARRIILETMKKYKIQTVGAYNCFFDRNALNNTIRYLTKSKYRYFFPYGTKFVCIWHMACQVIFTQKRYQKFAIENGLIKNSGNIHTSAEAGYKYYTKNPDFEEEHKGLDDTLIECQIMAWCYRQHKKMNTGINRLCWKIPQNVGV